MTNPLSYKIIVDAEIKKFLLCIEEAYNADVATRMSEGKNNQEELEKLDKIYTVIYNTVDLFLQDYILEGPEGLSLYPIDQEGEYHRLGKRDPNKRPVLESYASSVRALVRAIEDSYILKSGFNIFGLEEIRKRTVISLQVILDFLKYAEDTAKWTEKYLTWVEHGAKLMACYENTRTDFEEDEEQYKPENLYTDNRIHVYATLKATELNPVKLGDYLNTIHCTIKKGAELYNIISKLYSSLKPADLDNFFHMLGTKQPKPIQNDKQRNSLKNVRELNSFVHDKVKKSVEDDVGFINTFENILNQAADRYVSDFVERFLGLVGFLPTQKAKKKFIKQFERGTLWLNDETL